MEDVSQDQLDGLAGGETLRTSVTDVLGLTKNTKRCALPHTAPAIATPIHV